MAHLDLPSARLRVRAGGRGEPVVFAVDPPNVLELYGPLFVRLKPHVRLVAFEAPGFGHSPRPKGHRFTLPEQERVVVELLERLGEPATLAFPCVLAYVALRVAASRPDLVRGLVLTQAPSWPQAVRWVDRVDRAKVLRTPLLGQAVNLLRNDAIVRRWYETATASPEKARTFRSMSLEAMDHGARFPLASGFQALFRPEAPVFAPVTQPTLLVWGPQDRSHRATEPHTMRAHVPHAQTATLETSGHFPELEDPDGFARVLLAWLEKAGRAGASRT